MSVKCPYHVRRNHACPICARVTEEILGSELAPARGSAWQQVNAIFAEADKIEELVKLRMERPGETRETAHQWAMEQYRRYATPNDKLTDGGPMSTDCK